MRGREGKGGAPPTDLLVCFPSRTHLALMPKPASSPNRPTDSSKRRNHRQLVKSSNRVGHGSPVLWAKTKSSMGSEMEEPTSPKVTCAGQIKVKSKNNSCKNWQSVMEEIEKLHSQRKNKKKKPTWVEALGLKKDVTQFLSCLRGIKLDLRCFGSFHQSVLSSSDDEEEDEEEEKDKFQDYEHEHEQEQHHEGDDADASGSSKAFSKWFMVLEEKHDQEEGEDEDEKEISYPCAPPPNALLLMRCRSAPAKTWLEEKLLQEQQEKEDEAQKAKLAAEEKENKESLILKFYAPDFKVSSDIAKETWVVGGARDPLSRSRSWKR